MNKKEAPEIWEPHAYGYVDFLDDLAGLVREKIEAGKNPYGDAVCHYQIHHDGNPINERQGLTVSPDGDIYISHTENI